MNKTELESDDGSEAQQLDDGSNAELQLDDESDAELQSDDGSDAELQSDDENETASLIENTLNTEGGDHSQNDENNTKRKEPT